MFQLWKLFKANINLPVVAFPYDFKTHMRKSLIGVSSLANAAGNQMKEIFHEGHL